jgi:hypothetical protein
LKTSLEALVDQVIDAVRNDGVRIIILDDSGFDKTHKTIPMAMAVGRISRALAGSQNPPPHLYRRLYQRGDRFTRCGDVDRVRRECGLPFPPFCDGGIVHRAAQKRD